MAIASSTVFDLFTISPCKQTTDVVKDKIKSFRLISNNLAMYVARLVSASLDPWVLFSSSTEINSRSPDLKINYELIR